MIDEPKKVKGSSKEQMKEAAAKKEQEEKRKVRSKSITQTAAPPKRTLRNVKRMIKKSLSSCYRRIRDH